MEQKVGSMGKRLICQKCGKVHTSTQGIPDINISGKSVYNMDTFELSNWDVRCKCGGAYYNPDLPMINSSGEIDEGVISFNIESKEVVRIERDGKFYVNGEEVVGIENIGQAFITFLVSTKSVDNYLSILENLTNKNEADAVIHSVVCSLEGTFDFEGFPASNINYLQCIRRLVAGIKDIEDYCDPDVYQRIFK